MTENMMLKNTFTTFHARNFILHQQYREKIFTKFSNLISCLLVAVQNNELLMQNYQSRPSGSAPLLETNYGQRRWCFAVTIIRTVEDEDIVVVVDDVIVVGT